MISHVRLVEGPALQFMLAQARLISSALTFVLTSTGDNPARVRLILGADEDVVREFRDQLTDDIATAQRAHDARTSPDASRVRIPVDKAHLVYTALIVSTHLTGSEEEYNIHVGAFKENALALASGLTAALN